MPLFGLVHNALLAATLLIAIVLIWIVRRYPQFQRAIRLTLGYSVAINEIIWWCYRYSHEGFRFPHNLPLQLCDITVWAAVIACLTVKRGIVEFAYFAGIAGAGMALLTPDLWSPWPSYPAVYFFLAHGGIVIGGMVLVFSPIVPLRSGAVWRAFGWVVTYACLVGLFDAVFKTDYMYLCAKPNNASLLDMLGPWPVYLGVTAAITLALFFLLWVPARKFCVAGAP